MRMASNGRASIQILQAKLRVFSHVQSEGHVRQILLIGQDSRKHIQDYSNQFQHDFLQLLHTSHGEKKVQVNHFYQSYISHKEHIHMNATKWSSLTEFTKHLGTEGICRVEDTEKGLFIAWIDNSPGALRRRDAILKKERQDKGDEERDQRHLREQIERARVEAPAERDVDLESRTLQQNEGEKIKLNITLKPSASQPPATQPPISQTAGDLTTVLDEQASTLADGGLTTKISTDASQRVPAPPIKVSLNLGIKSSKNVLASKKNAFGGKKVVMKQVPKKMTEQERIMLEEKAAMERKQAQSGYRSEGAKRQKVQ